VLLTVVAVVVRAIGTVVFLYCWPRITVGGFRCIFTRRGLGGGPVPVNTIYAVRESPSQSAASGSVVATRTDDLLYFGGWLEVKAGPRVLHVPEHARPLLLGTVHLPGRGREPSPTSATAPPGPAPATSCSAHRRGAVMCPPA